MFLYTMCQREMDKKSIDALKGIGILGILLVHYGLRTSNEFILEIVSNGARGVQLMYIINAFLIFHSLSKIELTKNNIISWWKGKFTRLIPLYYFFTIIYLLVFGIGPSYYLGTLPKISWVNIIANLLFLHGFYPYYINAININWFMADLAIFYFVAPFLFKIINSLEKSVVSLIIAVPLIYIMNGVLSRIHILDADNIWLDYINIMGFFAEFPIMLLGIFCYYFYISLYKTGRIKHPCLMGVSMFIFSIMFASSLLLKKDSIFVFNNIFSFGIVFALIFIGQLIHPIVLIKNTLFELIGRHSFGIYLSQLFVLKYINMFLGELREKRIIDVIGYFLLVLVSYIIAIMSENIVEKNVFKLVKREGRKC